MFKIISTSFNGDRLTARVVFVLADATEVETTVALGAPQCQGSEEYNGNTLRLD
jgi:hypothetical protein